MMDRSRPEGNPPGGNRLAIQDHFSQRPVPSEGRQAGTAYSRLSAALTKILALPDLDGRLITGAVVQKIREQMPDYWLRRADEFEAAAPRPGRFLGQATREELSERWHECIAIATACRRHAALLEELDEAA